MKTVAMEFQHSETAFIWNKIPKQQQTTNNNNNNNNNTTIIKKQEDFSTPGLCYNIVFYTKDGTELALCGHATLAASSVVFQILATKHNTNQQPLNNNDLSKHHLEFYTKDNVLLKTSLAKRENSTGGSSNSNTGGSNNHLPLLLNPNKPVKISMEFPLVDVQPIVENVDRLAVYSMVRDGFHIPEDDLNSSVVFMGLQASTSSHDATDLLIELTTEAFMNINNHGLINYQALCQWDGYTRGVILCCLAPKDQSTKNTSTNVETSSNCSAGSFGSMCSSSYLITGGTNSSFDFFSRFFGPKVGILEDPVTGSAHCILTPYFSEKLDKTKLVGRQMSQRGGTVECSILKKSSVNLFSPMKSKKSSSTRNIISTTTTTTTACAENLKPQEEQEKSHFMLSGIVVTTMHGTLNIS